MKKILRTVAIMLICGALAIPSVDAQSRGRGRNGGGGGGRTTTTTPASRPGGGGRGNNRPATPTAPSQPNRPAQPTQPTQPSRPGNSGHGNGGRPQTPNTRPGHSNGGGGGQPGYRPSGPTGPSRPGYDHGHHPAPPHHCGPVRPNMPPPRPFYRPAPPPPTWHPSPCWNPIHTILGITIGSAFNYTLNTLLNTGYVITSYTNDIIYLDNVRMLNMYWPDAMLYFNGGNLYASRFVYSTSGPDTSRYDMIYTSLLRTYGAPVSVNNTGMGIETTWWGPGNQFINLIYGSDYSSAGYLRYYTVLSFGN